MVNPNRFQWLNQSASAIKGKKNSNVIYWMFRDKRAEDNWALAAAHEIATNSDCSLSVLVTIPPKYINFTLRHYHFMLQGLQTVSEDLSKKNIGFRAQITETPDRFVAEIAKNSNTCAVITDFLPLRDKLTWDDKLARELDEIPMARVDAHNIIPCWEASPKLEYAARTIRRKIMDRLDFFLGEELPEISKMPSLPSHSSLKEKYDAEDLLQTLKEKHNIDCTHSICDDYYKPGKEHGLKRFERFLSKTRLGLFDSHRNDPNYYEVLSGMSPYVNFGQVSIQRIISLAKEFAKMHTFISSNSIGAFVEEAVIRRELTDNFCYYNKNYDNLRGAYPWAQDTLKSHSKDRREYVYSYEDLENAKTHDSLWNAAQTQLNIEGKMHGFLRMYWAKKILEWTESPEQALDFAQALNDSLSLDGNDPNGYVGVGWSIMGIHDQGWRERPIFGKIRYMNYEGCKRKFNVPSFVAKYQKSQTKLSGDLPQSKRLKTA